MSKQRYDNQNPQRWSLGRALRPSGGKVGCTLLIFLGMAALLYVTSFLLQGCGMLSSWCFGPFGPGFYVYRLLRDNAPFFLGGWSWGWLVPCALILAGIYFLVCLWASARAKPPAPEEGNGLIKV